MEALILDSASATLLLSSVLLLTAATTYLIYVALSRKDKPDSGEYGEAYIGGEPKTVIRSLDVPVRNLFWGMVWGAGRRLYNYLRDRMHNGVMNDWGVYMITYIGVLSMIALIYFIAMR